MKKQLSHYALVTCLILSLMALPLLISYQAHSAGELDVEGSYNMKCNLRLVSNEAIRGLRIRTGVLVIGTQTEHALTESTLTLTGIPGATALTGMTAEGTSRSSYISLSGKDAGTDVSAILWLRTKYTGSPPHAYRLQGAIDLLYASSDNVTWHGRGLIKGDYFIPR